MNAVFEATVPPVCSPALISTAELGVTSLAVANRPLMLRKKPCPFTNNTERSFNIRVDGNQSSSCLQHKHSHFVHCINYQ
ncbi:hypothetical protein MHYP_G00261370 [Metynnis hypsauchen]